ncbi:MAG: flagellar hook-associated protein 3 [Polaromonas sp. 39-63-203]|uniref:flagellar hook-associated protein FlgL n=1 Tax=Polaromonas sp. TaxID=1869339 RepID=UPI000BDA8093|nr:flagellar hook-associated protein FlgL [Polaromonas sp.]OYY53929.1 MAG: flagellar hook-associated protein 3 [Polaromonas sp. 35-63-240]OYZ02457.1 MAG: flagellar hook-associated protein 3 [Polaromonas sp. 28-63-22]OYZ84919.1 MAG: flagellar hook-associated protein 3 [Polaromonas sp. 24-62-144]OZA99003.1 MAG: flagellar hook-associated protein 3 [Polaromonas sp. 39-63-203]HQS31575.1 flagellar hook-associated protein FlgL [Polaromonas sp.]
MRISTQSFYDQSRTAMGAQQSNLLRVQQQLGAGTKILAPSDDPLGATRALAVSQSIGLNAQYSASRAQATHNLMLEDGALTSVTSVLQSVKTGIIEAGNGTMSDADRATIATTLESSLAQLQGLANTDDGNGQFLFAGFKSGSAPFVRDASGITYKGDQGQRLLQVDVTRQMAGTDDGRSIFQTLQGGAAYISAAGAAVGSGADMFSAISDVIKALRTPVDNAGPAAQAQLQAALGTANKNITNAHDNVLTVRASVGSRLQELDALTVTGDSRTLYDKSYLSDLQDLDYASAMAEFYQRQNALQASQQTFVKIQQIALFNYL